MNKEVEKLVEWATIPEKDLTDVAEALYNFHSGMTIAGIECILWQLCRKQVRKAYSHPDLALLIRHKISSIDEEINRGYSEVIPLAEALSEPAP